MTDDKNRIDAEAERARQLRDELTVALDEIGAVVAARTTPPHVNAALATIGPLMTHAEAEQLRAERAADRDDAERVREVVRAYAIKIIGGYLGAGLSSATTESVACAVAGYAAAQLAAPTLDHVCPPPYGLGPEEVDLLAWLSERPMPAHVRTVLDKILAAHREPHS